LEGTLKPSRLLLPVVAALLGAAVVPAQEVEPPPMVVPEPSPRPGLHFFPGRPIYPTYLADPKSPEFSLSVFDVRKEAIPEAGSLRVGAKIGARFAVLRWAPAGSPDRPWQVEGEVGFSEQADPDYELDDIGWDGLYAILVCREIRPRWFLQFGNKHLSAHVGDEYAERTGRRRVGYTRDEFTLGATHRFVSGLTAYLELGVSFDLRDRAEQERWRVQLGIQREWLPPKGRGNRGWFAAANVEMLQELSWQPDVDLQGGMLLRAGDTRWRLGVQYRHGRVPLGEFTRYNESYLYLGVWLVL
jgi:hypothetical protein